MLELVDEARCAYRALGQGSGNLAERLRDTRRFGMHTQARSARFKTGRVLLSLPNKIPATAQNRTFVESSSVMRRSERPKMVSFGSLRRCNGDILLRAWVRLASSIGKRLIYRGMGRSSDLQISVNLEIR